MIFAQIYIVRFLHSDQLVVCQLQRNPPVAKGELIREMSRRVSKKAPAQKTIRADRRSLLEVSIFICRKSLIRRQRTEHCQHYNEEGTYQPRDIGQTSSPSLLAQNSVFSSSSCPALRDLCFRTVHYDHSLSSHAAVRI